MSTGTSARSPQARRHLTIRRVVSDEVVTPADLACVERLLAMLIAQAVLATARQPSEGGGRDGGGA